MSVNDGHKTWGLGKVPPKVRTKIAVAGANALQASGKAHSFSSEKARAAVAKRWENQRRREALEAQKQELIDKGEL